MEKYTLDFKDCSLIISKDELIKLDYFKSFFNRWTFAENDNKNFNFTKTDLTGQGLLYILNQDIDNYQNEIDFFGQPLPVKERIINSYEYENFNKFKYQIIFVDNDLISYNILDCRINPAIPFIIYSIYHRKASKSRIIEEIKTIYHKYIDFQINPLQRLSTKATQVDEYIFLEYYANKKDIRFLSNYFCECDYRTSQFVLFKQLCYHCNWKEGMDFMSKR